MADETKKEPKIILYEGVNFKGRSKTFTQAHPNMVNAGFFDCASSVIVEGGVWVLYQHHNYKGNICVVMEGDRTNLVRGTPTDKDTKVHEFNDSLSSLKPLDFDCTQEPKITVYAGDFNSRSLTFTEDIKDLRWYKMNDQISYIRVHSGAWVVFEAVNFMGQQSLFLPGDHLMKASDGAFRNDTTSSLRPLQIKPSYPLIVDGMDFHLDRVSKDKTPITVFSWTQKNNSKITQNLSVTKEKTVTTEDSYEFTWDEGTKMTSEYSYEASIPGIFTSSVKLGIEKHLNIGTTKGKKTEKAEKWSVHYPSEIPPESEITLESTISKGKIDVPFTCRFHQGEKKWSEKGTFHGVQYYGFVTEFKQK
ncbi:epidermal differentiation-specific protein-like [Mytilus trossulus]|uniref:epidermal differentiation-specific protein-like n=1 Tax=Mytilus trossulus TaxID=6551 RepID=UPI003007064A